MPSGLRVPVFFLLMLGLSSWHLDSGHNANTISRAAMVAAVVEHHTLRIDPYHNLTDDKALVDGHYYSEKAPLPALAVIPFWWLANKCQLITPGTNGLLTDELLRLGGFLCGSVPFALLITLTWIRLRERATALSPAWIAAASFFGSFLFVYSGSFHGHLLAALFIYLAWLARKERRSVWSGLFASAAVLSEYSLFVFPAWWLLMDLLNKDRSALLRMALGGSPGLLLLLFLNAHITGSPFTLPYSHVASHVDTSSVLGMSVPAFGAIKGLLFSSYRGLFAHAPVAILCVFAIAVLGPSRSWRGWLLHPLVVPSVLLILMIGAHSMWWGGWAFGPRHLTTVALLLLACGLPLLPDRTWVRIPFMVLSGWGLIYAFAAKNTTGYGLPTGVLTPFRSMIVPAVKHKQFVDGQWPTLLGFSPAMASFLFVLTFIGVLYVLRQRTMERQS